MYEVETICDKRINPNTRKPEYLVKWAGHPETNNSWEPEENLCFVKYLIEEYNANKKHKTASKNVDVQQYMPQFGWPPKHSEIQRKIKSTIFPQYRQHEPKNSNPNTSQKDHLRIPSQSQIPQLQNSRKILERQRSRQKNVKARSDLKKDLGVSFETKKPSYEISYPPPSFPYSHQNNLMPPYDKKPRIPPSSINSSRENNRFKTPLSLIPPLRKNKLDTNKKVQKKYLSTQDNKSIKSVQINSLIDQDQQKQKKETGSEQGKNYHYSDQAKGYNQYNNNNSNPQQPQISEQMEESGYNYRFDSDRDPLKKYKVLEVLNIQKNGDDFYYLAKTTQGKIWLQRSDIVPMYSTELCEFYEKNILFQQ